MPAPITTRRGESRAGRRKVPFTLTWHRDNIRAALAVDDGVGGGGLERDDKVAEKNGNKRAFDNPIR